MLITAIFTKGINLLHFLQALCYFITLYRFYIKYVRYKLKFSHHRHIYNC
jgi:hypothetical protein